MQYLKTVDVSRRYNMHLYIACITSTIKFICSLPHCAYLKYIWIVGYRADLKHVCIVGTVESLCRSLLVL